ncbi:MAG: Insecticidal toxin complex protein [Gelidibacter sp.]|nr:Insecticidal toxin complex protein [Gelidibacter sp.]
MRYHLVFLIFFCTTSFYAKEWKCLKTYQKATHKQELSPSDWLKSDRKQQTSVWKNANIYNLSHQKPEEYLTIKQRKDFYLWIVTELKAKGHDVVWPTMAYFISNKLRLLECFPYNLLTSKDMKAYALKGSEDVFVNSFKSLSLLYDSKTILKGEAAEKWDEHQLYTEQYVWIEAIYKMIDAKSLKHIERIAKGKSFYSIFVPKAIRFEGDISKPEERYNYAINKLKPYCKNRYQ